MKITLCLSLLTVVAGFCLAQAPKSEEFATSAGPVQLTPFMHASFMLQAGGKTIHFDPAQGDFDSLPKADLIIITHTHGDHLVPTNIEKLKKPETVILVPQAALEQVPGAKVMGNGDTEEWEGWTIEAVPAYNLKNGPAPGQFFHPKGDGNGYVLTYGGTRFYVSGDTEGIPEMADLTGIDVALVCMNTPYTMTPAEAAAAVKSFQPRIVIPYHFRGSDLSTLERELEGTDTEVRLLEWYPGGGGAPGGAPGGRGGRGGEAQ